jgi:hypothetical protein
MRCQSGGFVQTQQFRWKFTQVYEDGKEFQPFSYPRELPKDQAK